MPALSAPPRSLASQEVCQSSTVGTIKRRSTSICLRNRPTADRYGLRAAAFPHSSRTKLLVTKSARQPINSEKHACAALCHWSPSSQTANKPTVSKKTVMAGVHYVGQPHHFRRIGNVRLRWRKCYPGRRHDFPVAQPGAVQIPLRYTPVVRPSPAVGTRRVHRLRGSFSHTSFTISSAMRLAFPATESCSMSRAMLLQFAESVIEKTFMTKALQQTVDRSISLKREQIATLREELEDLNDYLDLVEARVRDQDKPRLTHMAVKKRYGLK